MKTLQARSSRGTTFFRSQTGKKIWVDLDNSPHVPFFVPIIEALERAGYEVLVTARDAYQVCELLEFHHLPCRVVGGHWGKNQALKIFGTILRALQLLPVLLRQRPDLAISHGSRAQVLSSLLLRIPTVTIFDYEFTAKLGALKCDWIFASHIIPDSEEVRAKKQVIRYPGLKEDVYVPRFRPDPSLMGKLGLRPEDLIVTVRPPATEAHYHNPEAEMLLKAALSRLIQKPDVRVILLPRNERQDKILRKEWGEWIANRKIVIPEQVVDGLNLIWFSDLVISGGGTMNREAAALGVPVYSIFRGRIGAVDRYLAEEGRLTLIENVNEINTKIRVERLNRRPMPENGNRPALQSIVSNIVAILESKYPISSPDTESPVKDPASIRPNSEYARIK